MWLIFSNHIHLLGFPHGVDTELDVTVDQERGRGLEARV